MPEDRYTLSPQAEPGVFVITHASIAADRFALTLTCRTETERVVAARIVKLLNVLDGLPSWERRALEVRLMESGGRVP